VPRRSFWNNAGTVASILIALTAAGFTGLQWREAHDQMLLSLKPHVDFDTEDDPGAPEVGITIFNARPGPAVVKSLAYFVDGKPVKDVDEVAAKAHINRDQIEDNGFDPGDTLAVNEKVWLLKYRKLRGGKGNPKDVEHFADFIDQRLGIEVMFCSVTDEDTCWPKCSTKSLCRAPAAPPQQR
jgi:hypothetical protein